MNYTHVIITMPNIHIGSVNLPFLILQLLYGLNCKRSKVLKSKAAQVTCFFCIIWCVTTLSIDTGKCLDVEVLTKVCHGCQRIAKEDDASKKADLLERHTCQANYKGSSPAMETEGIKRIFLRSETTRQLQYTKYFSDGDSKAYSEIEHFYDNVHEEKKECVGHVQKQVGTALRKLEKENKGIGGNGKLTDALIDKLQNYYGIAVRSDCGNLEGMKAAIYASILHCASSEKRNLHTWGPDGLNKTRQIIPNYISLELVFQIILLL